MLKIIEYLGVNILTNLDTITSENKDPLTSKFKSGLTRWNLLPFLILGQRVETKKMNMLPRRLLLFQNIPIDFPRWTFQELD